MKKNYSVRHLAIIVLSVLLYLPIVSCSSNDSDDKNGKNGETINIDQLVGTEFLYNGNYNYYNGSENVERMNIRVAFISKYWASVEVGGDGAAADEGGYNFSNGSGDYHFTVNGNTITIPFEGSDDYKMNITMTLENGHFVTNGVTWSSSAIRDMPSYPDMTDATEGNSSLYGYYLNVWGSSLDYILQYEALNRNVHYSAIYIKDKHTAFTGEFTVSDWGDEHDFATQKAWDFNSQRYYTAHFKFYSEKRCAYVMCGDKLVLSSGRTFTVKDDSLFENGESYPTYVMKK